MPGKHGLNRSARLLPAARLKQPSRKIRNDAAPESFFLDFSG